MADEKNENKQEKSEEAKQKEAYRTKIFTWIFFDVLFAILWLVAIIVIFASKNPLLVSVSKMAFVVLPLAILAMTTRFTMVEEGTCKIIMKGGEFYDILIQWHGRTIDRTTIDKKWEVVTGDETHPFGGIRLIWPFPLMDKFWYLFRWTSVRENGKTQDHAEMLDKIILTDKIYFSSIKSAEDANKVPIDLELLFTLCVVNPYMALFVAEDWLELVINQTKTAYREAVAGMTYDQILRERETLGGRSIAASLKGKDLTKTFFQETKEQYGVEIKKIEIGNVVPDSKYLEATTKKFLASAERQKKAGEVMGTMREMIKIGLGYGDLSEEGFNAVLASNPGLKTKMDEKALEVAEGLTHRRMAIDGGTYVYVEDQQNGEQGGGAQSVIRKVALEILAAWNSISGGKGGKGGGSASSSGNPDANSSQGDQNQAAKDFFKDVE